MSLGVPPTRKETNVAQSVREIMSPSPMTLPAAATAIDAAGAMRDTNMGDVIAMDDGQICGIVTDRDIAVRAVAEGSNPAEVKPGDVCSRDLTTLPYRQHRGRGHAYARARGSAAARGRARVPDRRHVDRGLGVGTRSRLGPCRHQRRATEHLMMVASPIVAEHPRPMPPVEPPEPVLPRPGEEPLPEPTPADPPAPPPVPEPQAGALRQSALS